MYTSVFLFVFLNVEDQNAGVITSLSLPHTWYMLKLFSVSGC